MAPGSLDAEGYAESAYPKLTGRGLKRLEVPCPASQKPHGRARISVPHTDSRRISEISAGSAICFAGSSDG